MLKYLLFVLQTLDSSQQTAHVGDIRQAVRFAVSDLKGQELLPGFCLPKVSALSCCLLFLFSFNCYAVALLFEVTLEDIIAFAY
jgi:hypothetical protein